MFIAIDFSKELKELLWRNSEQLKRESLKGNFTRKDNFHLTLRFIGEVSEDTIKKLKKAIDKVCYKRQDFNLALDVLGQFPRGNKSIVWLGLKKSEGLEELHLELEGALEGIGFRREERSFNPHITLGREVVLKDNFDELQHSLNHQPHDFRVNQVTLMESARVNGKLTYRPIYVKSFA